MRPTPLFARASALGLLIAAPALAGGKTDRARAGIAEARVKSMRRRGWDRRPRRRAR